MSRAGAKRILIYGVTGSGKTTLAGRLAELTGLTHYSPDDLAFEANWVNVPTEVQRERVAGICGRDEWIVDTAYAKWIDIVLARTELVICLDYPRLLSLRRLVRRTWQRARDGRPVCNGNRETFRMAFSKNSIVLWHFRSFGRKQARMRAWDANPQPFQVIRFTHPRDAEAWLQSLT